MISDLLGKLIEQKHDLLVRIHAHAARQRALIEAGDMTALLQVLGAKQPLMASLQNLERQLDPFRSQDPATRQWRSVERRETCRQTAARCEQLLRQIMELEQECEAALVVRRDQAATQLQGIHSATQAAQSYQGLGPSSGLQIDVTAD